MSELDFIGNPWWTMASGEAYNDYTRFRSSGVTYTMEALIGRRDTKKYTLITDTVAPISTTSGTVLV